MTGFAPRAGPQQPAPHEPTPTNMASEVNFEHHAAVWRANNIASSNSAIQAASSAPPISGPVRGDHPAMSSQADTLIEACVSKVDSELHLAGLGLSALPAALSQLTSLRVLNLSCNNLISIPASISKLTGLVDLDISRNLLKSDGIPRWPSPNIRGSTCATFPAAWLQIEHTADVAVPSGSFRA
jgi:hypothetical protein